MCAAGGDARGPTAKTYARRPRGRAAKAKVSQRSDESSGKKVGKGKCRPENCWVGDMLGCGLLALGAMGCIGGVTGL